ncbi:interleukin-31 receptor subunit alpha-like, partial [Osmerus eperlanus]|uniref:interleukin-31 receptor subunit alpha-like n=1 Tax=Osmerus eperlanus TaxID=29151 RepID=UPI002E114C94
LKITFNCLLLEVIPQDPYIELGSDIKILFKSKALSNSHGQIYWTLNNKRINEGFYETINSTSSAVYLHNFTLQKAVVQCHSMTGQVLGGTIIRTYQKPTNISCITYISKKKVMCNWVLYSSMNVNYIVYRKCIGELYNVSCSTDKLSCTFDRTSSNPCTVTVRAKTIAWEVDSNSYQLDLWNTVKPEPPENVKADMIPFSNHLKVKWDRPEGKSFYFSIINCQVKYAQYMVNTTIDKQALSGNLTIEVMEPCTNHTISVRCNLGKGHWSEWSREATVLSHLKVNAVQLHLWRKIEAPDDSGTRRVLFMWKGISALCKAIDGYSLEVFSGGSLKPSSLFNTTQDTLSVLLGKAAHIVTLTAFHGDILFQEQSTYVPATGESLPQVKELHALVLRGDFVVTWAPPDQPVSTYVVDWNTEVGPHNWIDTRNTNILLTGLLSCQLYNVSVTPLFHDRSGQENRVQICSSEGVPGIVSTDVIPQDISARVNWTVLPKTECRGAVVNYTVFYWNNIGPKLNITVERHKQEVLLEGLQPGMHYSFYVTANTVTRATNSSVTSFFTNKYDLFFIKTLSVCGGLFIICVLFTGLCCVIQWKSILGKMVPDPGHSSLAQWLSQNSQQKHFLMTQQMCPSNKPHEHEKIYHCKVDTMASDSSFESGGDKEQPAGAMKFIGAQPEEELSSGCGSRTFCEWEPREERFDADPNPPSLQTPCGEDKMKTMTFEDSFKPQALNTCVHSPYWNQDPVERLGAWTGETRLLSNKE